MARGIAGTSLRRWIEYLIAISLGNAIYYLSFLPHMPEPLRHREYHIDLGMLLDFLICLGVYGLIRLGIWVTQSRSDSEREA